MSLKTEIYQTPEHTPPHIIEYSELVNTVQLSVSRLLDIEGSIEAETFQQVQETVPLHQEQLMDEIGAHFDEALVNFVVAALVSRRGPVIIRAEAHEGLDGWLPWEKKLLERVDILAAAGLVRQAQLRIERYATTEALMPFAHALPVVDLDQLSTAA
jgi:hypothetical protein